MDRYLAEAMQVIIGYCGDRTKMQVFMLIASAQQVVQLCLNQPMSEGAFPPITTQQFHLIQWICLFMEQTGSMHFLLYPIMTMCEEM